MISIENEKIMIDNYKKIEHVSPNLICLKFKEYVLNINGVNLTIILLSKDEIIMKGNFTKLDFVYEL
ncbi:MAG: YabP/YqfC family sporulation protein [Erysipelotrichaceae bacterium]